MDLNLTINFDQLKSLIHQCGMEEKVTLVRMLEKETFPFRLDQLLKKTQTDDLTLEEITEAVEAVRERRYREQS